MTFLRIYQIVHQFHVIQRPVHLNALPHKPLPAFLKTIPALNNSSTLKKLTERLRSAGRDKNLSILFSGRAGIGRNDKAVPILQNCHRAGLHTGPYEFISPYTHIIKRGGGNGVTVIVSRSIAKILLQGGEFILVKKLKYPLAVMSVKSHVCSREFRQVEVCPNRHKEAAHPDVILRSLEKCTLLRSQMVEIVINSLNGAVESEKFFRAHFTNALHARHIVRSVTADGQIVNHLRRVMHTILFANLSLVKNFTVGSALPRFQLEYMVGHELAIVLVRSHHIHRKALSFSFFRHRAYHIVSFIFRNHQHRNVQSTANFAQRLKRVNHKLGCGAARSLVVRIGIVAESPSRRIEGHSEMCRMLLFNEFKDIFRKSEKNRRVHAL